MQTDVKTIFVMQASLPMFSRRHDQNQMKLGATSQCVACRCSLGSYGTLQARRLKRRFRGGSGLHINQRAHDHARAEQTKCTGYEATGPVDDAALFARVKVIAASGAHAPKALAAVVRDWLRFPRRLGRINRLYAKRARAWKAVVLAKNLTNDSPHRVEFGAREVGERNFDLGPSDPPLRAT